MELSVGSEDPTDRFGAGSGDPAQRLNSAGLGNPAQPVQL